MTQSNSQNILEKQDKNSADLNVIATNISWILEQNAEIKSAIKEFRGLLMSKTDKEYVDNEITKTATALRDEFKQIKNIVYGAVGFILVAFLTALTKIVGL
jgi:uncharacterized protein YydD (DUF2326 family)